MAKLFWMVTEKSERGGEPKAKNRVLVKIAPVSREKQRAEGEMPKGGFPCPVKVMPLHAWLTSRKTLLSRWAGEIRVARVCLPGILEREIFPLAPKTHSWREETKCAAENKVNPRRRAFLLLHLERRAKENGEFE
jgi:hypothetical protein